MEIKQQIGKTSPLIDDAFHVRYTVFIEEQGFDAEVEVDEYDDTSLHIVGYIEDKPVAVARLIFKDNNQAKIGRVAVLKSYRRLGLGKKLMHHFIDYAKENDIKTLLLSSQLHAKSFYNSIGFVAVGDVYLEEGAEHIMMQYHL